MEIDETDRAVLEYVANAEPWHVLCAVFRPRFQEPAELVERVFRLRDAGLIEITPVGKSAEPTAVRLLTNARDNGWYEDTDSPEGDTWSLLATDLGFEYVHDTFEGGNA